MNHISRVQIFYGFEQLIHNILLVDVLQYVASFYHIVQISVYNNFIHSAIIYTMSDNRNLVRLENSLYASHSSVQRMTCNMAA